MRRPSLTLRGGARNAAGDASSAKADASHTLSALLHRAQQWFAARERLIASWFAHLPARAAPKKLARKQGGAGAIVLPFWWEYESELKCRLALEALLRRLFSLVPAPRIAPA
jgi:hypothetical protein